MGKTLELVRNRLTMVNKFSKIEMRTELSPFCIYTPIAVKSRKGLIQFAKLAIRGIFVYSNSNFFLEQER